MERERSPKLSALVHAKQIFNQKEQSNSVDAFSVDAAGGLEAFPRGLGGNAPGTTAASVISIVGMASWTERGIQIDEPALYTAAAHGVSRILQ